MRAPGAWLVRLAMAGSCLAWAGCGGSGVPDPDSDSAAAAEQASKVVDRGSAEAAPAPAPEAAAPQTPAKPQDVPVAGNPTPAGEGARPATVADSAPADGGEKAAPAAKGDASGTEDLLRLAGTPAPPAADAPAAATPAAAVAASGPAAPGSGAMMSPPGVAAAPPSQPAYSRGGPGYPSSGSTQSTDSGGARAGGGKIAGAGLGAEDGAAGTPPGRGGSATPGGDLGGVAATGNASFQFPTTAVNAFLAALKAKDKDRLSQATARRSATEAEEKHQKIFAAILEQSISDEELDDLSKALDGFQVMSELPAKSTGRIGVLVGKQSGRDFLRRTMMVRKEKDGWKVMDIANMYDFKPGLPPMFRGRGRRR